MKKIIDDGDTAYYNPEGELHNPHGPAVIEHDKSGAHTGFALNGKCHNIVGPGIVEKYTTVYAINNYTVEKVFI